MSKRSTAAVVRAPGQAFVLERVELDDLRAGEVLVKIEAAGVCHTDMNMQHVVPMPAVLGHEGAGVVEEIGAGVEDVKPGDRVIISWPACGECLSCISGRRDICELQFPLLFSGRRQDGSPTVKLEGEWISGAFFQQSSFATYAIAPANSLVLVGDDLPPELLAALPCGIMTGAGSILNALKVGVQDDLLVFGAGGVGLSAIMAARLAGAYPIIAVDINPERLDIALELGATHALNAGAGDVVARVKEIAPHGVRFAFDTSGIESSWKAGVQCLGMGATFGIVAVPEKAVVDVLPIELLSKGAGLQFILAGSATPRLFLPRLIEWYKQGRFPFDRLVKTFPFADINSAFAESVAGRAIKPVLLMP
ncbi:MAG: NAD(P)-dependent alcohol dehydrogenase [bacterium]